MTVNRPTLARTILTFVLLTSILASFALIIILQTKKSAYDNSRYIDIEVTPFPISVDPLAKRIEASTLVDQYHSESLAHTPTKAKESWLDRLTAKLAPNGWYQQLASPVSRIFVIWPGERREEVAAHIAGIQGWTNAEKQAFINKLTSTEPALPEGTFYPGQYVTHKEATPDEIATLINDRFRSSISARYTKDIEAVVPLHEALIIASLLEREASDFQNMREVSGVIWNRRFIDMPLQLDATLQYVRGSNPAEPDWWPAVHPSDKYLDSPFNTYKNPGLPPYPIANVTAEAVLAALNPLPTDCLFYFHDQARGYHCSPTYEEHVSKLRQMYGRGR